MAIVSYLIDGVDLRRYGIYVSKSHGLIGRPAQKERMKVDWPNRHGLAWNHRNKRLQPREIELKCFVRADGIDGFTSTLSEFFHLFDQDGPRQLLVAAGAPLVYMVECEDSITVEKTWNDGEMVGTFSLRLIESEPVKRLFAFIPTQTIQGKMTIVSEKALSVYWGDGSASYDVMSHGVKAPDRTYQDDAVILKHTYPSQYLSKKVFIVVAGDIDALPLNDIKTTAQLIWERY